MTRAELDERWTLFVDGQISRREVHDWADPHVRSAESLEPMVLTGLQTLHGATGAMSQLSVAEIALLLVAWRTDCIAYDADPAVWRRTRATWTLRGLHRDYPEKAPAAAAVFLREGILTDEEVRDVLDRPTSD
jgi:hypothetical protein